MKSPQELDGEALEILNTLKDKELSPKDRMAIPVQEMPSQPSDVRAHNVQEVALGYSPAQAQLEAMRCLNCKNAPCMTGCPVKIRIPDFLAAAAKGDFDKAYAIISESTLLPAVCGRVCPQERQCQKECTLGKVFKTVDKAVAIGRVERFCADRARECPEAVKPAIAVKPDTGKKVAVIGSGPSCITVAADVRRQGHAVTMFEALQKPGGVLVYGIPEFRLPKAIVKKEIDGLQAMGVDIQTNYIVGRTRTIEELVSEDGFDAIFIGTGAGLPKFMNIPGENLVGVVSANEYLTRANLMKAYDTQRAHTPIYQSKKVAVLGGGNVAMDAARMALRLGAEEVRLVYRRSENEMPARIEEIHHAKEEGVIFHTLQTPLEILGDENDCVTGMRCIRFELGEPDASGRRAPVEIPGSEFIMEADTVIVAIGNGSNPLIKMTTPGLETNKRGNIVVDENNRTSIEGIYAGGDIVLGAATVILAMGEGRRAAEAINRYLAQR